MNRIDILERCKMKNIQDNKVGISLFLLNGFLKLCSVILEFLTVIGASAVFATLIKYMIKENVSVQLISQFFIALFITFLTAMMIRGFNRTFNQKLVKKIIYTLFFILVFSAQEQVISKGVSEHHFEHIVDFVFIIVLLYFFIKVGMEIFYTLVKHFVFNKYYLNFFNKPRILRNKKDIIDDLEIFTVNDIDLINERAVKSLFQKYVKVSSIIKIEKIEKEESSIYHRTKQNFDITFNIYPFGFKNSNISMVLISIRKEKNYWNMY